MWYMVVGGWYAVLSLITLAVFSVDKARAGRGDMRVPERTLHLLELLGGWPGAFLAMRVVRHKNRKPRYWIVTALIAAAHAAAWAGVARWARSG